MDMADMIRRGADRYLSYERELRTYDVVDTEMRADGDGNTLVGHAAVFNIETNIGGFFREVIAPGAFKKTIKEADVRHLFNHNPDIVLARTTNDTLKLDEDTTGLAFEARLNMKDPDAVSVKAKVERQDVTQSSFAFRVIEQKWTEPEEGSNELPLRTILQAQLCDTSTVTYPAYAEADTGLRALGLSVLSTVLGMSEASRAVIMRAVEGGGELPNELEAVVDEWRAASKIANLPDDHPDQLKDDDEEEDDKDQPAADDAPDEEGNEESEDEPAGSDDDDKSDDESGDQAADEAPEDNEEVTEDDEEASVLADLEKRKRLGKAQLDDHALATL